MLRRLSVAVVLCCASVLIAAPAGPAVRESARDIPVAYDVDVVIVGGSSGAVSAALAAKKAGATVFLAAPRPYVGDDLCASMRLWLEEGETPQGELAMKVYTDTGVGGLAVGRSAPFKYASSIPSATKHKDTNPPSRLSDGVVGPVETQSVQYDGDVVLTATLGKPQIVREARIALYHRAADFAPKSVAISFSEDGSTWSAPVEKPCTEVSDGTIMVGTPVGRPIRQARFAVTRGDGTTRVLIGEIILLPDEPAVPAAKAPVKPVRPMHVKGTLDEALLSAGVPYLFGCYTTDVLRDADGKPAGIVMANRSGRQAVRAKVIVDATDRAAVARLAGAKFAPYPTGEHRFIRNVIGGEKKSGQGIVEAKSTGIGFGETKTGPADITQYTLTISMADGSFASFARAEQVARDLTESAGVQAITERLFQVPPDPMKGRRQSGGEWKGAGTVDLDALRPAGIDRMYVLGGCADVSRPQAEKLLRPVNLMPVGERVGQAAAAEAQATGAIAGAALRANGAAAPGGGDVRESLTLVRPMQKSAATVRSPERALPILGTYDVVVVGAGTGGAPAGIAAARNGANVLVLEYLNGMGGVGTMGLISSYYWGYRGGFTASVPGGNKWNPLEKAEWWRTTFRTAGGETWFGVLGCGAYVEEGMVKGVVVATPDGRGVVLAKVVIDSTGSADVAASAGAQTIYTGADELAQQGTGLPRFALGPGSFNTDFTLVDETDAMDVWHVLVYAKNKYQDAFDLGQLIDTRERRRIVGEATITLPDCINSRTYPDTISIAYSNFDTHGYTVDPYLIIEHPERKGITVHVPYRSLLPRGLEGILVTGLGISAHRDALPLVRMQPDIQNQGYAAGLIAATAAKQNLSLRKIDLPAIQKQLAELAIIPPEALGAKDSYPMNDDQVRKAVADAPAGTGMSVILTHAEKALPMLREAYASAADPKTKLTYARILGVMGDRSGVELLAKALDESAWDRGWNYTGMGQFGSSLSEVDRLILALARTRDPRALEPILRKAEKLDASSEFSHHRTIALALELLGGERSAEALFALLSKPQMQGYVVRSVPEARKQSGMNPNDNTSRATSLRELFLGRALYRCGDREGLGRKILESYSQDLRGHWARHAQAVLEEKR